MIAVDADSRACLGLVGGSVWNREGLVTPPPRDRPLQERGSRRWVETAEQAAEDFTVAGTRTIEQLFRTMKSQGLRLEDSQLETAERLVKLTAAAAVKAACITMQLVQERDGLHGRAAAEVFSEAEIDTFEALTPTLERKTERQKNPHPPRSLARASWVVARLGGWNCYYRPPGPITMRRGLERFHAIHQGRMLGSRAQ